MMRSLLLGVAVLVVPSLSVAWATDVVDKPAQPLSESIERLSSDESEIRQAANEALAFYEDWLYESPGFFDKENSWTERDRLRGELKPHISTLTKLLKGKHEESRQTAAGLLGLIGPDAASAGETLLVARPDALGWAWSLVALATPFGKASERATH